MLCTNATSTASGALTLSRYHAQLVEPDLDLEQRIAQRPPAAPALRGGAQPERKRTPHPVDAELTPVVLVHQRVGGAHRARLEAAGELGRAREAVRERGGGQLVHRREW
eukprot:CAMPEP_0179962308 /NCGR_PEP_ID=MMETSP0983-20121128/30160_1 /TAXON_ID=483367 /ORGANISM="non described non described, Strain CCMP 2436" /LENGTH=108 /DNA_ID=CAMNT_0021874827 /DNA_START=224 /DNA_END=547 /DNA_ORIENTATION=-